MLACGGWREGWNEGRDNTNKCAVLPLSVVYTRPSPKMPPSLLLPSPPFPNCVPAAQARKCRHFAHTLAMLGVRDGMPIYLYSEWRGPPTACGTVAQCAWLCMALSPLLVECSGLRLRLHPPGQPLSSHVCW